MMLSAVPLRPIWFSLLLLAAFALLLIGIQQQSLWLDEAWTADVLYDAGRPPEGIRDTLRFLRDSFQQVFEQVRVDVHPPLYFVLLDSWTLFLGESELALRLPSALAGLIAAAGVAALGRLWLGERAAWFALILLVTSGFFLHYGQEARMLALLLALATLMLLAFAHHLRRPRRTSAIWLIVAGTLALYTHYVVALLLAALLLYALMMRRWWLIVLLLIPALLFVPWLPFALEQWRLHPQGAAALPLASDMGTLAALALLLTSGYWFNFAVPLLLALPALRRLRDYRIALLLLLWALVPTVLLFLLNAQGIALLQIRYLIPILLPWTLLLAWALDRLRVPRFGQIVPLLLLIWLAFTQFSMRDDLWHSKPRWRDAVAQAAAARSAIEPLVMNIAPHSPVHYYDRRYLLTRGYTLDIGWRSYTPDQVSAALRVLEDAPRIWTVLPMQDPVAWDAIISLTETRSVGYRDSVQGTILYRFEQGNPADLRFLFGTIALDWSPRQLQATAGETLCLQTGLPDVPDHSMLIALTRGYHEVLAQVETPAAPQACLDLPPSLPAEALHLRLYVLDPQGTRLPLTESGLLWGDYLMLGSVQP